MFSKNLKSRKLIMRKRGFWVLKKTNILLFLLLPLMFSAPSLQAGTNNEYNDENGQEMDHSWESTYVFPLKDEIHVYDKSIPLPEILRVISTPAVNIEFLPVEEYEVCGPFPLPMNDSVKAYMRRWTMPRGRKSFARWLRRSGTYEDMITTELKRRGMPEELLYLSMIESGFQPKAVSHAAAKGLWQFIRPTGEKYDLEINYWVDERYDPEKSTDAALNYLSDLYAMFGDWHLAAASYNTGEGFVKRRQKKTGCKDYWCLCDQKALKAETRGYLPKIIAAAIIGKNPERYGFYNIEYLPPLSYSKVTVQDATDLNVVAKCAGTSLKDIQRLNPSLLQFCTPPGRKKYKVKIPEGSSKQFKIAYNKLSPDERSAFKRHTVVKGQTIKKVASGYGASSKVLASMNGLPTKSDLREGQVVLVPVPKNRKYDPYRKPVPEYKPKKRTGSKSSKGSKSKVHILQPDETLWNIAQWYGVTVEDLKTWNGIDNPNGLQYGDKIVIKKATKKPPKEQLKRKDPVKIKGATRTFPYTVREGDRCYYMARHYGITSAHIAKQNKLDPNCPIRPGQKISLTVPESAPKTLPPTVETAPTTKPEGPPKPSGPPHGSTISVGKGKVKYIVKEGDNLWLIARRHDTHIADVKKDNNLSTDSVSIGQALVIKTGSEYKKPKSNPKPQTTTNTTSTPSSTTQNKGKRGKTIYYIVEPGDSLWWVAKKHDVFSSEIREQNNLSSDNLRVGQKLAIKPGPGYKKSSSTKKTTTTTQTPKTTVTKKDIGPRGNKITYTVQEGDSLWLIANKHDVHVWEVKQQNGLESDSVRVGQKLSIKPGPGYKK
jgi:peptidoglycan lytic transglycosylase D